MHVCMYVRTSVIGFIFCENNISTVQVRYKKCFQTKESNLQAKVKALYVAVLVNKK